MNQEPTFIQETITVIRPTTSNHIFDEEKYEKTETYDKAGQKIVLLREKEKHTIMGGKTSV